MNKTERSKTLKALGLPATLFDEDFPERYEKAVAIYHQLVKRQAELDASGDFADADYPYKQELEEWKATGDAYTPGPEVVQDLSPMWAEMMDDWCKRYKAEFLPSFLVAARLKKSWNNPPAPGTKMHRLLVQRGIDPQALMDKLIAERDAERGL